MSTLCFLIYANLFSISIAFALDHFLGDPPNRFHPICSIGAVIRFFDKHFNNKSISMGTITALLTITLFTGIVAILLTILFLFFQPLFIIANTLIIYFGISVKSLVDHAKQIHHPLVQGDLTSARHHLAMIVSRDTNDMESDKIVTSTIESVSENFVDGIVSPVLFAAIGGGIGITFFKTVSTMDSMIGYKSEPYHLYGKFSAKLDDVLNFIPARLSILPISFSALLLGLPYENCLRIFKRDRKNHDSPNSAHAMSAFAGALELCLGGATRYDGTLSQKPTIGDPTHTPVPSHIIQSVRLMKLSSGITVASAILGTMMLFDLFIY